MLYTLTHFIALKQTNRFSLLGKGLKKSCLGHINGYLIVSTDGVTITASLPLPHHHSATAFLHYDLVSTMHESSTYSFFVSMEISFIPIVDSVFSQVD